MGKGVTIQKNYSRKVECVQPVGKLVYDIFHVNFNFLFIKT